MKETLEKMDIFNPKAWMEDGRWVQPPFSWLFFMHWSTTDIVKRIAPGAALSTVFTIDGYAFHSVQSRKALYDYLKKAYEEGTLKQLVDRIDTEGDAVFQKVQAELEHPDSYIEENMESFIKLYTEFVGLWTASTFSGDQMTLLAKDVGYVTADADLFGKVQPYLRETWLEEEVHAMKVIAQKYIEKYPGVSSSSISENAQKDTEISTLISNYIKKFVWSRISKWVGEPVDEAYSHKRLTEEVTNLLNSNNVPIHKGNIADEGYDGVVALCVSSAYWRAQSAKIEMMTAHRMRGILKGIALKNNIEYKQVLLLAPHEFVALFNDPQRIIKNKEKVLSRDKTFFSTLTGDGQEIVLTPQDPEFALIENIYLKRHYETTGRPEVLKGIGASKGHVQGVVRVIESSQQFESFKDGEILVAAETSPTFVPLMRASAAILTGKGGITSHAAIVSRELGKPCIIAIKDVTRILKTGDRVDVDADKGIVRIIN